MRWPNFLNGIQQHISCLNSGFAYISSKKTPECFESFAKAINGQCKNLRRMGKNHHKDLYFCFSVPSHTYFAYNRSIHTNFSTRRLQMFQYTARFLNPVKKSTGENM